MPEYSNTSSGSTDFSAANNPARYKCNDPIVGTNYKTALDTYHKLYTLYTDNDTKMDKLASEILTDTTLCAQGTNGANCPHNPNNPSNLVIYSGTNANKYVTVRDLAGYIDDCGARLREYDNNINSTEKTYSIDLSYATNLHDVSYNYLVNKRNNLDLQMNEFLANNKNSILNEKQRKLDACLYSTLLWTVMITSLLYYVFTKI